MFAGVATELQLSSGLGFEPNPEYVSRKLRYGFCGFEPYERCIL
jgi:hypothetical protein